VADDPNKAPGAPEDVEAIRLWLVAAFEEMDDEGRLVGDAKFGVYAFFDYDGEPIYVGQTREGLRTRIRRHLTNQRTDAVAMNVLDPFEVLEIAMWPLWELENSSLSAKERKTYLDNAEFTVFQEVLAASSYGAVLNEKNVAGGVSVALPDPTRARIVPDDLYPLRKHPDVRIARRASTIAALAKVISERNPSKGLRRTLVIQARRLERLAAERYDQIAGSVPAEMSGEETGEAGATGDQDYTDAE
jgi:hypothetical protein